MLVQQLARTRTQRMVAAAALCGWMDAVRVLVQQLSVDKEGAHRGSPLHCAADRERMEGRVLVHGKREGC
jgi:hypothetical protein